MMRAEAITVFGVCVGLMVRVHTQKYQYWRFKFDRSHLATYAEVPTLS